MKLVERSATQWAGEFAAVRGDAEASLDAFARAVLGIVAEPGDGVLGRLIATIGAAADGRGAPRGRCRGSARRRGGRRRAAISTSTRPSRVSGAGSRGSITVRSPAP